MEPIEALERIAYALERSRQPTYRVRAFRNAAAAISGMDSNDLRDRALGGTLRSLPGIGETTEKVIIEALTGQVPAYLAQLEGQAQLTQEPGLGKAVRATLKGDCHSHSDWSDGGSSIKDMALAARAQGHQYWALTDHSPHLTIAKGLTADRLRRQLDLVGELNQELAPFRILTGIEVDILEDGALDQEEDLLAGLDIVVASVHSKLRMETGEMTRRMLRAIQNPLMDILGHCTGRLVVGKGRPESTFDAEQVFSACAEHGVAVEINSRPERLDPPRRLLRLARDKGCLFSIDTDAHAPGQLEWLPYGCARAEECEVPLDSVVNSWTAERLLEWTKRA